MHTVYPLPMPQELDAQVRQIASAYHLSLAEVMRQGLAIGLPKLDEALKATRTAPAERQWQRPKKFLTEHLDEMVALGFQMPERNREGVGPCKF